MIDVQVHGLDELEKSMQQVIIKYPRESKKRLRKIGRLFVKEAKKKSTKCGKLIAHVQKAKAILLYKFGTVINYTIYTKMDGKRKIAKVRVADFDLVKLIQKKQQQNSIEQLCQRKQKNLLMKFLKVMGYDYNDSTKKSIK